MKKKLQNMDVQDKKVIVRFDYNVPLQNGKILDDSKIKSSLETIDYLTNQNCKIIILSHFGKPKKETDKDKLTLKPIYEHLKSLIKNNITFIDNPLDINLPNIVEQMNPGDILLLENTRFLDLKDKLESNNDAQVASFWASLADVFVLDAFASSHRDHASTVGISKYIPSCLGLSIQKEIETLSNLINNPVHPFTVIMGGAKIEDKLDLIEALLPKCDYLLLAGGIANSFLKTLKFDIGSSLATNNKKTMEKLKNIMLNNREKLMLPLDAIVSNTYDEEYVKYRKINEIDINEIICDIGVKTIEKYKIAIMNSNTVFLNGTMGLYEDYRFSNGTKEIFDLLKQVDTVVVGGGDSVSAVNNLGYANSFTYLSTGGGATLEFLAKGHLVAIDNIAEDVQIEVLDV